MCVSVCVCVLWLQRWVCVEWRDMEDDRREGEMEEEWEGDNNSALFCHEVADARDHCQCVWLTNWLTGRQVHLEHILTHTNLTQRQTLQSDTEANTHTHTHTPLTNHFIDTVMGRPLSWELETWLAVNLPECLPFFSPVVLSDRLGDVEYWLLHVYAILW